MNEHVQRAVIGADLADSLFSCSRSFEKSIGDPFSCAYAAYTLIMDNDIENYLKSNSRTNTGYKLLIEYVHNTVLKNRQEVGTVYRSLAFGYDDENFRIFKDTHMQKEPILYHRCYSGSQKREIAESYFMFHAEMEEIKNGALLIFHHAIGFSVKEYTRSLPYPTIEYDDEIILCPGQKWRSENISFSKLNGYDFIVVDLFPIPLWY